jgi:hypothetical protein
MPENESPIMPNDGRMKPMLIVLEGTMKPEDIQRLNDNGVCTVESKDPAAVRLIDALPSISSRTKIEDAAIELSRKLLRADFWNNPDTSKTIAKAYCDILLHGTRLDAAYAQSAITIPTTKKVKAEAK